MENEIAKKPALIISFRLRDNSERNLLKSKADNANTTVTNFLRGCIFGNDSIKTPEGQSLSKTLIDDMNFMFRFFNKNAGNLDISLDEKIRFKAIQQKIVELMED